MSKHFGMHRGFASYQTNSEHIRDNVASALRWLEQGAKRPFFLFVHGYEPHKPYRSTPQDRRALGLAEKRPRDFGQRCKTGSVPADVAPYVGEYDAAVRRGDDAVGRLLDGLRKLDLLERTIIIFTSDHGEEFFEHGGCYHVRTLYQELLRVPLIIRAPGVPPERVAGVVPASVAIAPTALALLGFADSPLPGPSLADTILRGRKPAFAYVASETGSADDGDQYRHSQAWTGNREKLIHWVAAGRYELFDLDADPSEQKPVRDATREAALARELDGWAEDHSLVAKPQAVGGTPRRLKRRLRALGYAQ
jgi:arylsulfatase A-like enzyme